MRPGHRVLSLILGLACVVAAAGSRAGAAESSVRLLQISSRLEARTLSVLIETSEPVPYLTSQPDNRTVLIDLRRVDATAVQDRFSAPATGPVAAVAVEQASSVLGEEVARIRISLRGRAQPRVRSDRTVIAVEFDRGKEDAATDLASSSVPLVPVRPTPAGLGDDTPGLAPARTISAVRTNQGREGTVVTLVADGALTPAWVGEAGEWPPRLVLDFAGVKSSAPARTPVGGGPVEQIRIARNSDDPLVTRVVLDLVKPTAYRVEPNETDRRQLRVFVSAEPSGQPSARATAAPPPAAAPPSGGTTAPDVPVDPIAALGLDRPRNQHDGAMPAATAPSAGREPVSIVIKEEPRPPEPVAVAAVPAQAVATDVMASIEQPDEPAEPPVAIIASAGGQPVPQPDSAAAPDETQVPAGQAPPARQFTGHPVSLDFQNADLRAVLRTFAEISGLNIVIDPTVQGTVDVSLRDVPWDQALDIILRANRLGYVIDGTVVRIAPLTVLADEEAQRRKLAEEQALSGELQVLTRTLSYARGAELAPLITRTALSPRGTVQVDERTNTIIITDLPERLTTASQLIDRLDRPEPQVEIEARIVQTSREFARAVGVQWGLNGRVAPELGNTTGLAFPNRGTLSGRTGATQSPADPRATPFEEAATAVNLPAAAATSAIGLALGSINGSFNLDVALSALERTGQGRILSSPRVATQNNVEAEVTQGIQIPIQTVANNTVTVTFKDAALTLRVTPQITSANTVIMRIVLENASPDFSRQVNGIPPIDTQRANTQVLVDDGETTVIGGIFVSREQTATDRVPLLHRIPLLGWLFRRDSVTDESRELLIFITPRILR